MPGPEDIQLFSCSALLSTKVQLHVVFIMLINGQMPTFVGIFNIYEQDLFRALLS